LEANDFYYFSKVRHLRAKLIVETKANSLVWRYRTAKPYYVSKYLPPLKKLLEPLAQKLNLKVEQDHMMLEVRSTSINKGNSALEYSKNADFVMAIGDDATDEEMFLALPPNAWTIKVGAGPTAAPLPCQRC